MAVIFDIDGVKTPRLKMMYIPNIGDYVSLTKKGEDSSIKYMVESVEHVINLNSAFGLTDTIVTLNSGS